MAGRWRWSETSLSGAEGHVWPAALASVYYSVLAHSAGQRRRLDSPYRRYPLREGRLRGHDLVFQDLRKRLWHPCGLRGRPGSVDVAPLIVLSVCWLAFGVAGRMGVTGLDSVAKAVGGPDLAGSLADLGLIDEYRLYFHPVALGRGTPFFAGPRPRLRLLASDRIGETVIRLTYVPA